MLPKLLMGEHSRQDQTTAVGGEVDLASQNKKLERRITELELMLSQFVDLKQVIRRYRVYANPVSIATLISLLAEACNLTLYTL